MELIESEDDCPQVDDAGYNCLSAAVINRGTITWIHFTKFHLVRQMVIYSWSMRVELNSNHAEGSVLYPVLKMTAYIMPSLWSATLDRLSPQGTYVPWRVMQKKKKNKTLNLWHSKTPWAPHVWASEQASPSLANKQRVFPKCRIYNSAKMICVIWINIVGSCWEKLNW